MTVRAATRAAAAALLGAELLAGTLGCPGPEPHALATGGTGSGAGGASPTGGGGSGGMVATGGGGTGGSGGQPCTAGYMAPECFADVALGTTAARGMPVLVSGPTGLPHIVAAAATLGTFVDLALAWDAGSHTLTATEATLSSPTSSLVMQLLAGAFDDTPGTDVVMLFEDGSIGFASGNGGNGIGTPSLTTASVSGPVALFAGDLDGDARRDLGVLYCATTCAAGVATAVRFLASNGDGTFSALPSDLSVPGGVRAGVLGHLDDGEGRTDLVLAYDGGFLELWPSTADPARFGPPQGPTTSLSPLTTPSGVVLGNLEGVPPDDVFVTGAGGVQIVGNGAGSGNLGSSYLTSTPWLVDMNGDNPLDLVVSAVVPGGHSPLYAERNGAFTPPFGAPIELVTSPSLRAALRPGVAVGDLNGDGAPDIVLNHTGPGVHVLVANR
ncbi:MAG: VCBS repeat-containing protein [Polyangiaceae bacterium]|nr:VCBS repeat-containing protein [Polyangiaceae bacterium]